MLNNLIKLANYLDSKGFQKEADYLDNLIKISSEIDYIDIQDGLSDFESYKGRNEDKIIERDFADFLDERTAGLVKLLEIYHSDSKDKIKEMRNYAENNVDKYQNMKESMLTQMKIQDDLNMFNILDQDQAEKDLDKNLKRMAFGSPKDLEALKDYVDNDKKVADISARHMEKVLTSICNILLLSSESAVA